VPEVSVLDQYFEEIAARLERRIDKHAPGNVSPKRLFNVPEAAEYLGRSENAVKLLIHRGKLPVTRIDSKSQIDKKALRQADRRMHILRVRASDLTVTL
jgi:hypothetical protein